MDKSIPYTKLHIALFLMFFFVFLFIIKMFYIVLFEKKSLSLYKTQKINSVRGQILSADGYDISISKKVYSVAIDTKELVKNKKEFFIDTFSIYSNLDKEKIRKKINSKSGYLILSNNINPKQAKQLKSLNYKLLNKKVFSSYKKNRINQSIIIGLSVYPSGELRTYPYKDLLSPIIGYTRKNNEGNIVGIKGLESKYSNQLQAIKNGEKKAKRDLSSFMILNKESIYKKPINGNKLVLTISIILQKKIEKLLDKLKEEFKTDEIIAAVMQSSTGEIISLSSSNRFNPKFISKKDYPNLKLNAFEYLFEPGSVIKPITFTILLAAKKVKLYELVNTEGGKHKIGKVITDEYKSKILSAEDIIVYSSNIGMAKLSLRLSPNEFYKGFKNFGFTRKASMDIKYENKGTIPNRKRLKSDVYKSRLSYGYGIQANFMQILKAYNVFNTEGKIIEPKLVKYFIDKDFKRIKVNYKENKKLLSKKTANKIKNVLIKTVKKGSAIKAYIQGLEIAGKTGTAHIAKNGIYTKTYNSSFFGFANDKKNKYTIGIIFIKPKKKYHHFASLNAAIGFKKIVEIMLEEEYLKKDQ